MKKMQRSAGWLLMTGGAVAAVVSGAALAQTSAPAPQPASGSVAGGGLLRWVETACAGFR